MFVDFVSVAACFRETRKTTEILSNSLFGFDANSCISLVWETLKAIQIRIQHVKVRMILNKLF
jgi:hypothetical protein